MPNLIMEYSSSVEERINVPGLLEDLHNVALNCGLFDPSAVKSRSLRCQHWLIGLDENNVDFIYVSLELLSGRTEQQKSDLSRRLLEVLQQKARTVQQLSVNIIDMDKASFNNLSQG